MTSTFSIENLEGAYRLAQIIGSNPLLKEKFRENTHDLTALLELSEMDGAKDVAEWYSDIIASGAEQFVSGAVSEYLEISDEGMTLGGGGGGDRDRPSGPTTFSSVNAVVTVNALVNANVGAAVNLVAVAAVLGFSPSEK